MPSTHLDPQSADRVSRGLIRVMKLMQVMRHHAPRIHPAVDAAAYPLLFNLAAEPRRVSALADCVHSDVSTVSRQVSTLVGHGLLEKLSDPDDGRAQVVRLSDEGHELLSRIQQHRNAWFGELLSDWTVDEAAAFAAQLERFAATLEGAREQATGRGRNIEASTTGTTTAQPTLAVAAGDPTPSEH
ncbi:MarR family winged helix-turn-helix transcriptional regulator [Pedococcus sp. 5OH_020]|uniref:MarR family winged helix-turn-helix transcriptional regulator n=1 Tax=Pedococcus sp. 5OH_020 TaxID=2989814 RepID=UPI0022E9C1DE|nr:MarR family transcriptional regulator [Pedococcus sp. 5OH_020]